MFTWIGYVLLGLLAGSVGGFAGVAGGIIIIPVLILVFGYDQIRAQGTSLAVLLPPTALLAFLQYWNNPDCKIDLRVAAVIAVGVLLGGFYGGKFANILDPVVVRKSFAIFIACASIYLFFKR